jgi:hypothetical protein
METSAECRVQRVRIFMKNKFSSLSLFNALTTVINSYLEMRTLYSKVLTVILASIISGVFSLVFAPDAVALTQIKLSDVTYKDCPQELAEGTVSSGGNTKAASCFLVFGKAENPTNKIVYDADIFGRIYDANNDSIFQNRTRVGSIPEVPPGVSDFEFRITVPANQPTPLQLKQFKAAGFSAQVRK